MAVRASGEFGMDVARGVQAEVPDLHEAARQDVQKKTAHEFQDREPTDFLVARAEDDLVVIDVQQPLVRDGDPVGVQAKVLKESIGFSEGCLGIDHPVLLVQSILEASEGGGLDEIGDDLRSARTGLELALVEQASQTVEEFSAKQFAEHLDREQEFLAANRPTRRRRRGRRR